MSRIAVVAVAVVLMIVSCGGPATGPSDSAGPPASGSSSGMNVRITDSPFGSAQAVLVTFSEVAAQRDGEWTKVPFPDASATTWTCDLKKLQDTAEDLLATGRVAPGQYTWLRLIVQSGKIYFDRPSTSTTPCARSIAEPAGASAPLTIASSDGRVNGEFSVKANAATTILVDFDGESSIRDMGNRVYTMNPVIRLVRVQ
jgi:hypothetical protein